MIVGSFGYSYEVERAGTFLLLVGITLLLGKVLRASNYHY